MSFTKIQSVSLTDLFIQQIENMILSSELSIGEQLPSERDLSLKMGVSRPVVSAGIVELEKLGFVEVKPRQGIFVCDYRRKGSMETLEAIMRYNNGAMRQNEVRSLLEVREVCECLILELVLKNHSSEEIESIFAPILDDLSSTDDIDIAAQCVFRFYHELAVMSGNAILPLLYYSFKTQGLYLWSMYCKQNGIKKMYELKLSLFKAMLNKDLQSCINQTRDVLNVAIRNLALYGA